jgi:hypothetical protein
MPFVSRRFVVFVFCALAPVFSAAADRPPATQPSRAFARFVPEADDDVAWENDRIAFRVYGPALAKKQKTGSGIDVWVKSTRSLVIDRWYKADDYRRDHGEGLDFYHVGEDRGCGGLGVWNGKSLDVSSVWTSHKILRAGPDQAAIELVYAPWKSGSRRVWETRQITLDAGSNLNRIQSTIDSDQPGELIIGIGLSKVAGEGGEATLDKAKGLIAYWQPPDRIDGSIACGVRVDPAIVVRIGDIDGHYMALIRVAPGKPFVYYAGAGWSKSGDFPDAPSWEKYVRQYKASFQAK